jgi:hypothetical protein
VCLKAGGGGRGGQTEELRSAKRVKSRVALQSSTGDYRRAGKHYAGGAWGWARVGGVNEVKSVKSCAL